MLACLLLVTASLTGCVKFKQVMTVMPDGSGKMTINVGLSEQLVQMAQQQGENPFDQMDPIALGKDAKGIVAFSKPTQVKEGGYTYLTFSAYFDDINQVELGSPDDEEAPAKFTYVKDGKGATLSIEKSMILSAVADHEPISDEEKVFAAQMTAGMSFVESYNLPGSIEAVKGVAIEGSTATLEMTQEHMLNSTGPIKDLKGVDKLTFKITEVKEDAAALAAFKAEVEIAKKEWEAMKKEAEAKAAAEEAAE
ncbi:MAG: hypothetical protein AB8C95_12800 [Phycisphaeraceae bacterium]